MLNNMFSIRRTKKLDLSTVPVYVVAPQSYDEKTLTRNAAVLESLQTAGFQRVEMVRGAYLPREPLAGCSLSHAMAVEQALSNGPSPFLLVENDAIFESDVRSLELDMLDDADAVYLGISTGGLALNASKAIHHWQGNFYSWCRTPNLVRIYNMLTTHAVLINSNRMARHWQLAALEGALRNEPIDCVLARCQRHFQVYAQRKPWFYQAECLGGQEQHTRVEFRGTKINSVAELPKQLSSFCPPCITADLATIK